MSSEIKVKKKMQCREFREISDSFLNDELLVETNLQVYRHLESCADCRADFAARRRLREKLKTAVRNAGEYQIDPLFFDRLQANLAEAALMKVPWRTLLFNPIIMVPAMAALLLALTLAVVYLKDGTRLGVLNDQNHFSAALKEIILKSVGKHHDCALEKLGLWEAMSSTDYAEKASYTEKVLKPLQAGFSADVEMLHVHDCVYQGKQFKHVILRNGPNVVSVFFNEMGELKPDGKQDGSIMSEVENGLRVASFYDNTRAVLVVSDLPENENLRVAQILLDAWKQA